MHQMWDRVTQLRRGGSLCLEAEKGHGGTLQNSRDPKPRRRKKDPKNRESHVRTELHPLFNNTSRFKE